MLQCVVECCSVLCSVASCVATCCNVFDQAVPALLSQPEAEFKFVHVRGCTCVCVFGYAYVQEKQAICCEYSTVYVCFMRTLGAPAYHIFV